MPTETAFLNIDLDIGTHTGLDRLLHFFAPHAIVLHRTNSEASLESLFVKGDIDDTIRAFLRILAGMDEDLQALWRGCEMRRMNIGIEAGERPHAAVFLIGAEAMKGMADAGCDVAITVYTAGPAATYTEQAARTMKQ